MEKQLIVLLTNRLLPWRFKINKSGEPKLAASRVSPQKLLKSYAGKSEIK